MGDALECLLKASHENWLRKRLAKYENAANIASLYKKGDHENSENYRPIRKLSFSYTLFAYIIHEMISNKLDHLLGDSQSGFRNIWSTVDRFSACEDCKT